ncbi:MAG: transporter substrate-binding domain-containing protein [Proteobacteria bacterium]|nr:transporter substrate-binding domain-containing protein [Pseudomonadota bacterium]MBU1585514.1 transporter substrate-binding domain-containing protein [Pseudomonadota bacterium]MBU2454048.1 transporter substrate-binding domain-containing protein [Pseudomonadota bacterium]
MKTAIISFCLLILMVGGLNADQKILLVTGEWSPYTSEKIEGYGFFTEIVSAIFKDAGLEVEYKFYPWQRCESLVKSGTAFATFPYKVTEDRKKTYDFSHSLASSTGRFFYLKKRIKSDIKWESFTDLKPYSIGGTKGYWYEKPFKENGLKIYYGYNDENGIRNLWLERVDLLATEELVGWSLIKKMFPQEIDKFDTVKKPLNQDNLSLMISLSYPNAASIKEKFNVCLERIKGKGVYSKILKKHNIKQ